MKKVGIALVLLLVLGVGLLVGLKPYGFDLLGTGGVWDTEKAILYKKAEGFLQSLQYKDFATAAAFHTFEDEQRSNIPKLIERLFKVKPEQLNIREIKITRVDFDDDHQRARTHFTAITELLNSAKNDEVENKEREVEGILYWHKRPASEDDPPVAELLEVLGPDGKPVGELTPSPTASKSTSPAPKPTLETRLEGEEEEQWFLRLESSLQNP